MIENSVGRPVRGGNFFDREREQRLLWQRLATDHVLLLAPRRVGKTSLLYRLADDAPAHELRAVYLTVAHAQREVEFVKALVDALGSHKDGEGAVKRVSKGPLKRLLRRTRRIDAGPLSLEFDTTSPEAEQHWTTLAEELASAMERLGHAWLVLVDELPIFVMTLLRQDPSGLRARAFLNWFRDLRNPAGRAAEAHKIRWVIAGSIGLDAVVARYNVGDTINDLNPVSLGAFSPEVADAFLRELATSYGLVLDDAVRARVCERAGWLIPFYLQIIFSKLHELATEQLETPSVALVDRVVDALLGPTYRAYFDYWRQRLTEELGHPDDTHALALLSAAARAPEGASRAVLAQVLGEHVSDAAERDAQLRYLLDILENDGYLVLEADQARFRSALLREFWLRRVV